MSARLRKRALDSDDDDDDSDEGDDGGDDDQNKEEEENDGEGRPRKGGNVPRGVLKVRDGRKNGSAGEQGSYGKEEEGVGELGRFAGRDRSGGRGDKGPRGGPSGRKKSVMWNLKGQSKVFDGELLEGDDQEEVRELHEKYQKFQRSSRRGAEGLEGGAVLEDEYEEDGSDYDEGDQYSDEVLLIHQPPLSSCALFLSDT